MGGDFLWGSSSYPRLAAHGVSWVGFYLHEGGNELVLGPSRDKPACSPMGLHGVCGRSFTARRPVVVSDVRTLGENYVACDPRDLSEVPGPLCYAPVPCGCPRTRALRERRYPLALEALPQLIAGLAADAAASTGLAEAQLATPHICNELHPLGHRTGLLPAHGQVLLARKLHLLPMSPV